MATWGRGRVQGRMYMRHEGHMGGTSASHRRHIGVTSASHRRHMDVSCRGHIRVTSGSHRGSHGAVTWGGHMGRSHGA
eukprot:1117209-Prymnesium_polylepis.1